MQLDLPLPVDRVEPDMLVACVHRIDELYRLGTGEHHDIIAKAASEAAVFDERIALAAVQRIRALMIVLQSAEWLERRYRGSTPPHLPPEILTRAAAVTPLDMRDVFCVEALERAILMLMGTEGRA